MEYPRHVALIPDGNRTWAKERWLEQMEGHLAWFQRAIDLAMHLFEKTPIADLWVVKAQPFGDDRGYFFEIYNLV